MSLRRKAVAPQTPEEVMWERLSDAEQRILIMAQPGPSSLQSDVHEEISDPVPWEIIINWPGHHRPAIPEDNVVYYHPGQPATEDHEEVVAGWKKFQDGAYFHCKVTADPERYPAPVVGDGEFAFFIPEDVDGMFLWRVEMGLSTPGGSDTVVQLRNSASGDMLSTPITVDAGDQHSDDSATPYVIDESVAQVAFKNWIFIDIDEAAADSRGLTVYTFFR